MGNPWEEIALSDYENHMKLDSVMQLQGMNRMMKEQFRAYPARSVMILGIAGGNGLEHITAGRFQKIYGVDVNAAYLEAVRQRYPALAGSLECLRLDLTKESCRLPRAELLIANLLVEYIGYRCFQKAVRQADPHYVSCVIQINMEDGWVSASPYLHAFDGLEQVHHQIEENAMAEAMAQVGYSPAGRQTLALPNGKTLLRLDFARQPVPAGKHHLGKEGSL